MPRATCRTIPAKKPAPQEGGNGYEYLASSSPKDKPWDDHRAFADRFTIAMNRAALPKYAGRVAACASSLFFDLRPDHGTGELVFKLNGADFCHVRHCPICQWRRSMRNKAIFLSRLPEIEAAYPQARWLMLTLTVRNPVIQDLRETLGNMNRAWRALLKRPEFSQVQGWIRATEVTRADDGTAHPHFHCLLMVPPCYFGKGYVPTARWARVWGECLKVDYVPVTDARAVRPKMEKGEDGQLVQSKSPVAAAAAEVLKYATKGQDLLDGGPEWLAEFVAQVHGLKFLTSGGALKGIFNKGEKEESDDDLIHPKGEGEGDAAEPEARLRFDWHRPVKKYARKRYSRS